MAKPLNTRPPRELEESLKALLRTPERETPPAPSRPVKAEKILNETPLPPSFNPSPLDTWGKSDPLRQEMDRLAAEIKEDIAEINHGSLGRSSTETEVGELEKIQREYEDLLEEKSESIRLLHQELAEVRTELCETKSTLEQHLKNPPPQAPQFSGQAGPSGGNSFNEDDLQAWAEELEQKYQEMEHVRQKQDKERDLIQSQKAKVDKERAQLREEKDLMERDLGKMEAELSQERVAIKRQLNELQRLFTDVQREFTRIKDGNGSLGDKERAMKDILARRPDEQAASKPGGSGGIGGWFKGNK